VRQLLVQLLAAVARSGAQLVHRSVEQLLELAEPRTQRALGQVTHARALDLHAKPAAQYRVAPAGERGARIGPVFGAGILG
jgi:hypothetical protein